MVDGDQMTFARIRVFIPNLPIDGDYRVITPYSDITYTDQKAGDKIFETLDVGLACVNTFECTLGAHPRPVPAALADGRRRRTARPCPTWPPCRPAPTPSTTRWSPPAACSRADPGTGKKYLADPARVGPITGSPLPPFVANEIDGTTTVRNHNTFRVEIRHPVGTTAARWWPPSTAKPTSPSPAA